MTKKNSENWSRIETLYIVLLAFGVERLGEGAYASWSKIPSIIGWPSLANLVLLVSIALWGARLFWSATNIQRYMDRHTRTSDPIKSNLVIAFHLPVLIGQSIVFFLVCESYKVIISTILSTPCRNNIVTYCAEGPAEDVRSFSMLVVASLVYNAFWLISLMWTSRWRGSPEAFWIKNNLSFALLITLAAFALSPTYAARAWQIILIYGALLGLNSFFDFLRTSKVYLNS